jgi:hypothetical protein
MAAELGGALLVETIASPCVGPATVISADGDHLRLRRGERVLRARLALAYSYAPEPGDVVLTIGDDELFVIGVLAGRGKTRIHVPGDLEISAGGAVDIVAGREIRLRGPKVTTVADQIHRFATTAFDHLTDWFVRLKDTLDLRAGRTTARIEGSHTLWAERIVERAEKQVKIDGSSIHLG